LRGHSLEELLVRSGAGVKPMNAPTNLDEYDAIAKTVQYWNGHRTLDGASKHTLVPAHMHTASEALNSLHHIAVGMTKNEQELFRMTWLRKKQGRSAHAALAIKKRQRVRKLTEVDLSRSAFQEYDPL